MKIEQEIAAIFPEEQSIPEKFSLKDPFEQRDYLIKGERRRWNGPLMDVYSPVRIRIASGLRNKCIGRYPLLTEKESMEALEAAVNAYGDGMGYWTTLSVGGRLKHMEDFVYRMRERKKDVVDLLMWEVGKPAYLVDLVKDAKKCNADVVNPAGGAVNASFFYPAILYPVTNQMRVYYEEQFGPVIPVVPFKDIKTPIQYVVESKYGQQLSIFGKDPDIVADLIDPLVNQVCRVNINSQCQRGPDAFPFTGRKDSAEGTLSVSDALRVFSIRTLVAAKEIDLNKGLLTRIVREHKSNFLSTDFIL